MKHPNNPLLLLSPLLIMVKMMHVCVFDPFQRKAAIGLLHSPSVNPANIRAKRSSVHNRNAKRKGQKNALLDVGEITPHSKLLPGIAQLAARQGNGRNRFLLLCTVVSLCSGVQMDGSVLASLTLESE